MQHLWSEDGPSLSFRQTLNLPAVKITGADSDLSSANIKQQQLSGLPMCDSMVTNKTSEEVDNIAASSGTPDEASVEAVSLNEMKDLDKTPELVDFVLTADDLSTLGGSSASDTSDDDEDFLDLLVDSLDGEFDPNLLLWSIIFMGIEIMHIITGFDQDIFSQVDWVYFSAGDYDVLI